MQTLAPRSAPLQDVADRLGKIVSDGRRPHHASGWFDDLRSCRVLRPDAAEEASGLARIGWEISALHLARAPRRGWVILEMGNVYPR